MIQMSKNRWEYDVSSLPVLKWGPQITTYFAVHFRVAEMDERSIVLSLAADVGERVLGLKPYRSAPSDLSSAAQERVRLDLHTLVELALEDDPVSLSYGALRVARIVKAYDLAPEFARLLPSPGLDDKFLQFISESHDPRNLGYLVPLLNSVEYRNEVLQAITACFTSEATSVVSRAGQDANPAIRVWAMEVSNRVMVDETLRKLVVELTDDPVMDVCIAAITASGAARFEEAAPRLLALIQTGQVMAVRHAAVDALGRMGSGAHAPLLRELADRPQEPLRGVAISALGWLADPEDYPRLLALLSDVDDDLARKARIALTRLPLTPAQRKAVDDAWEANDVQEPLDNGPTATPVTSPSSTVSPTGP